MGETKRVIERSLEAWNAHDKAGWTGVISDDCDLVGPGGLSGSGRELRDLFYSMWQDAFPDNRITPVAILEDGENGVLEAIFEGTQTSALKAPGGAIPPTHKRIKTHFVVVEKVSGGRVQSFHLYFDQVELLTQLGVMPAPTTA
jgi:ketosteroid isomerase-like protein